MIAKSVCSGCDQLEAEVDRLRDEVERLTREVAVAERTQSLKEKESPEEFNRRCPVGTTVWYFPIAGELSCVESRTRSEAWSLGSGHTVVLIEGKSGGVHVSHILVRPSESKAVTATKGES